MELILGGLVVLAALAFVVLPLVRGAGRPSALEPATPSAAEQRAAIYRELLDLELDMRVGKLDEADYRELADALLARAAALIAAEDAELADIERRVEQEIAATRAALRTSAGAARGEPRQ